MMTDNDIIKALECCSNAEDILVKGKTYKAEPLSSLFKDALDLINRQKAENERLANSLAISKKENERYITSYKTAKAEAITEFAERVTIHFGTYTDKDCVKVFEMVRLIDQIAKEMKGGGSDA